MSSSHPQSITLYTAKICPYAHRVEIALAEANANFKVYQIDLANKPDWYAPKVNPASKVPAIAYGGPDVAPENPSPESTKLAESLVLVEFVADLYPQADLLPQDPVLRAKTRFFIEVVSSKFGPAHGKFVIRGEGYQDLLAGVEAVQEILPDSGKYAIGDQYTIADIALTPIVARTKLASENELGRFEAGQGGAFLKALDSPKYAKFNAYVGRLFERQSFKATFDKEYVKGFFEKRFARAQ
ncbi:maleylacetoacetate isomerase [Paxillus involutus ATCC 200175]|uniref:Maleylacetoacetate isomerase n=1 Tax=Paxillus involutus ATCC 200175 TaxID=664439 RepID=A0A0C9U6X5_PAXIN|nr:maleylacetoacetate isomerase [Paxillus involutus ATCC 200175]